MTFTFKDAWNPAGRDCAMLFISQIEFRESMHVRRSVCRAPLRFAAVRPSCRADGGQATQIGETVDVVGRFSWTRAARGVGVCSEAALNESTCKAAATLLSRSGLYGPRQSRLG